MELATSKNIKSKLTKKAVGNALKSALFALRNAKAEDYPNGTTVCAGSAQCIDGAILLQPSKPIKRSFYRCDSRLIQYEL